MTADVLAVAERFFRAVEKGDVEGIRAIYAPDARIWHNNDGIEQTVDENLRVLAWVAKNLSNRRYKVKRRVVIPGGFMQQHVLEADTVGGPFAMPACIVCEVRDGRITRLEEYLDSAQAGHLRTLVAGKPATSPASKTGTP
jgi:ketosteroid isomerase-like protein